MRCGSASVWRGVVPCAPACPPDGAAIRNVVPVFGLSWAPVSWSQMRTALSWGVSELEVGVQLAAAGLEGALRVQGGRAGGSTAPGHPGPPSRSQRFGQGWRLAGLGLCVCVR